MKEFDTNRHLIHGADYNPDQWLGYPDILREDMRLMKLANMNSASVGIFAWSALEPREGEYTFEWLDDVIDRLHQNGASVILATPSGARPAWMDKNHPEVLRTEQNRVTNLHGKRHNHCYTSPYYRQKTREINALLAKRYKGHPALSMWHISNEYGGDCHCELCQSAFRLWLQEKYEGDIEKLNHAWWAYFWSHKFTSFSEIESPAPHGENQVHGHNLDWRRFVTYQTTEFMKNEIAPLREITPEIPVTTNFMGAYTGLDYWKMAGDVDIVSWDNYPFWHNDNEALWQTASDIAFVHDINRSLKGGKPFLLMESTPSQVNWQRINKLKRPGMHILSSMQAIAHGSDSVQYFQWRKSRGSSEKHHGAVVDHCGHEHTRVFKEVQSLGELLQKIDGVAGGTIKPEAALVYDWENRWAIDDMQLLNDHRRYEETCKEHYRAFWKRGIPVDVISMDCDFSAYKLIAAPMLYMLKPGVAQRLEQFVANGGRLITTYLSGYVNETDLCFLGGMPGDGLQKVAGIWAEELDLLYESDENEISYNGHSYKAHTVCEIIHPLENTKTLAVYGSDFYKDQPAITENAYKSGKAYHIAARTGFDLLDSFYGELINDAGVKATLQAALPEGVTVQKRIKDGKSFLFIMNFSEEPKTVALESGVEYCNLFNNERVTGEIRLNGFDVAVLA